MENSAAPMMERLENQLAQILLYVGAIESLAETYRAHEHLQHDAFLFGPVYEGLWDGVIVRLGTIWDDTGGVASLPKLSKHLQRLNSIEAKSLAKEIRGKPTPEWLSLKEWCHTIVAHAKFPLDATRFDSIYQINIEDVRKEVTRVEQMLARANSCLGRSQLLYQVLKENAATDAKRSLERWASAAAA